MESVIKIEFKEIREEYEEAFDSVVFVKNITSDETRLEAGSYYVISRIKFSEHFTDVYLNRANEVCFSSIKHFDENRGGKDRLLEWLSERCEYELFDIEKCDVKAGLVYIKGVYTVELL